MQSRRTPRPAEGEETQPNMTTHLTGEADTNANANALLVGRLERIPVTKRLLWIRVIIGSATFFDAYTVLVIAFAMPQPVSYTHLTLPTN